MESFEEKSGLPMVSNAKEPIPMGKAIKLQSDEKLLYFQELCFTEIIYLFMKSQFA